MLSQSLDALRARVMAAVDGVHAETVYLSMLADHAPDPERPAREIEAVLRTSEGEAATLQGGRSQDWMTTVAAGRTMLHVDRYRYGDLVLREGDRVRAVDRAGAPWYGVLRVDDRGLRLVAELGEA